MDDKGLQILPVCYLSSCVIMDIGECKNESIKQYLMAKKTPSFPMCHPPVPQPLRRIVTILLLTGLAGCAAMPAAYQNDPSTTQTATSSTEAPSAPFDPDTLYSLLVAELAAYDQNFDITLHNYMTQARESRDPGVAERAYEIAAFLNARDEAGEAALLWFDVDPDNPQALKAIAVETLWQGDIDRAFADLIKVREKSGSAPFQFVAVQAGKLNQEERDRLIAHYRKLLKRWPDDHNIQLGMAILFQQQGDLSQALAVLEEIQQTDASNGLVVRLKGQVLADMGRMPQALKVLQSSVQTYPDDVRLRLLLGRLLVKNGSLTEAQREFEVLVEQQPANPDLLLSVGLIAMENGLLGQAGLYFSRLAMLTGYEDIANFHLGRLAQQMDDWQEGMRYFLAVQSGPQLVPAYAAMTRMLADRSMLTKARQQLKQARSQYPDYAPQFFLIEGEVLLEQRRYDAAIKVLDQGLGRYPQNVSLLYSRAMLAERLDDLSLLERHLRKILAQEPDNAIALNALGYTLADRTNRLTEAKKLIYHAFEQEPEDPAILDSMGWVEYRLGNHRQALVWLRKAYAQIKDAEIAAHLGEVLWMSGRKEEAQAILNEAQERQPNAEILQSTLDRLLSPDAKSS